MLEGYAREVKEKEVDEVMEKLANLPEQQELDDLENEHNDALDKIEAMATGSKWNPGQGIRWLGLRLVWSFRVSERRGVGGGEVRRWWAEEWNVSVRGREHDVCVSRPVSASGLWLLFSRVRLPVCLPVGRLFGSQCDHDRRDADEQHRRGHKPTARVACTRCVVDRWVAAAQCVWTPRHHRSRPVLHHCPRRACCTDVLLSYS